MLKCYCDKCNIEIPTNNPGAVLTRKMPGYRARILVHKTTAQGITAPDTTERIDLCEACIVAVVIEGTTNMLIEKGESLTKEDA